MTPTIVVALAFSGTLDILNEWLNVEQMLLVRDGASSWCLALWSQPNALLPIYYMSHNLCFLSIRMHLFLSLSLSLSIYLSLSVYLSLSKSMQDVSYFLYILQLPFALLPILHFTNSRRIMGDFANGRWAFKLMWANTKGDRPSQESWRKRRNWLLAFHEHHVKSTEAHGVQFCWKTIPCPGLHCMCDKCFRVKWPSF